jgi:DNA polymerase elongation subunit (family B)
MQKLITGHKILIGFNNYDYDNVVLKRHGINLDYKIIIDLMAVIKKRATIINIEKGLLSDLLVHHSLDFITKLLNIVGEEDGKIKFDYSLMNKEQWTAEEMKTIKEYTVRDIEITKKLYEWLENYFGVFKQYLNTGDIDKKIYVSTSTAKLTYKIVCKELGWPEKYNTYAIEEDEDKIGGGYVSYPSGEFYDYKNGPIYCRDVKSMYPHIFLMCNLHSRQKEDDGRPVWTGDGVWKVEGKYYADELGELAKHVKKLYNQRLEFKKIKDRREYAIKILLNSLFGATDKEYYELIYDKICAGDCTRLGRQWAKYARKKYHDAGYYVIYTDTDSIYLQDPFNDKARLEAIEKEIVEYIKSTVPFPQDTFGFGVDEYKYLYFFKGTVDKEDDVEMDELDKIYKGKQLMKKNYIMIDLKDKIYIKNLGLRKKSNSDLSRKIFWEFVAPKARVGEIKFGKAWMYEKIKEELRNNIMLAAIRKDVGSIDEYEKSLTGLQAQISRKYGSGIYFMIPNVKGVGVGKGCSYCTVEEFKANNMRVEDIELENYMSELSYFIKEKTYMKLFDFGGKKDVESKSS